MKSLEIVDADIDHFLEEYNSKNNNQDSHLEFDDLRRTVLKSWNDVQACPGSGKTTLVAVKLLILSKKWSAKHQGICALTHTNVACDEIRERLQKHPAGYKLTTYPHFIGTIQEFVNKYLGLPYLRGKYQFKRFVEDAEGKVEVRRIQMEGCTVEQICRNLYRSCNRANYNDIKDYLGSLHLLNSEGDLRFFKQNSKEEISRTAGNSDRWKMLSELKNALFESGIFQYRDIYSFADRLLSQNTQLSIALRKRFPIVFVDEMQDTQKFQDELINLIFDADSVNLQRLGDPDQAIFDNMGGEEPNETFNNPNNLDVIKSTHRFGKDIASKIHGLSITQIGEVETFRDEPDDQISHTIMIYRDDTKTNILEQFAILVEKCDPEQKWTCIKAVGATEGTGGFISKYWSGYDRRKSVKKPKPEKLIHLVKREWWTIQPHSSCHYSLLLQGVVDVLRLSDTRDIRSEPSQYFSARSLSSWLKDNDKQVSFRKLLTTWIYSSNPDSDKWATQTAELRELLCLTSVGNEVTNYLAYDEAVNVKNGEIQSSKNIFQATNGREIEVGTIHSVKGETHDATLVLETKFKQFDVKELLDHIALVREDNVSTSRKSKFMRQLYVATSRPRHLLCLAVHENHISIAQRAALENIGWNVSIVLKE